MSRSDYNIRFRVKATDSDFIHSLSSTIISTAELLNTFIGGGPSTVDSVDAVESASYWSYDFFIKDLSPNQVQFLQQLIVALIAHCPGLTQLGTVWFDSYTHTLDDDDG